MPCVALDRPWLDGLGFKMTWLQRTFALLQIFGISVGQARAEIPESWEIYFLQVNSVPSTIAVDLGLREAAPIAKLPQLLWVTIALKEPNQPNGMQSATEQPTLIKIDEAIMSGMKECANGAACRALDGRWSTNPVFLRRRMCPPGRDSCQSDGAIPLLSLQSRPDA
jgi:hypothetical protein